MYIHLLCVGNGLVKFSPKVIVNKCTGVDVLHPFA